MIKRRHPFHVIPDLGKEADAQPLPKVSLQLQIYISHIPNNQVWRPVQTFQTKFHAGFYKTRFIAIGRRGP